MFVEMSARRKEQGKKQVVSLQLSADTIKKAKMLVHGYTGVPSRLLDLAINNPEVVKKCL